MNGSSAAATESNYRRAVAGLWLASLFLRFVGIGFLLPYHPEPDDVYALQPAMMRGEFWHPYYASYPLLVGDVLRAWPGGERAPNANDALDRRLAHAAEPLLRARYLIALVSSFAIPATYALARGVLAAGPALLAALFAATSLMLTNFSQQGRPHAAVAAWSALAVAASIRALERDRLRDWIAASGFAALALGFLHNGLAAFAPVFAALAMRGRPRSLRDAALWLAPLAALAASVRAFYPYLFGGELVQWGRAFDDRLQLGSHYFRYSKFDGSGFGVLLAGLWNYDPVLTLAATCGIGLFVARALIGGAPRRLSRPATIIAAFAVPYAMVFGAYGGSYERFVLPLVPVLAVLAAAASSALAARAPRHRVRLAAASIAVLALALPTYANLRLVWLRSQPDTLRLAADFVRAAPELRREPLWIQPNLELPLATTARALKWWDPRALDRTRMFWTRAERRQPCESEPAIDLRPLPDWDRPLWRGLDRQELRAIASLDRSCVVCARYLEDVHGGELELLHRALDEFGARVVEVRPIRAEAGGEPSLLYQNEHFLWAVLHAEHVGPTVEIGHIDRRAIAAVRRR